MDSRKQHDQKKSVSAHTKYKELLYAELDTMYRNLNKSKFPVFVMGDFNARIGFRGNPIKQVGKFGDYCEKFQNENGQFLTEFSNMHYLCPTKTFFQKSTRKWTWRSNLSVNFSGGSQRHKANLDEILVKNNWITSVMDNTIAPLDPMISDHRRSDLKFRLKFCIKKKLDKSDRMRIDFFKDPDLTKEFVTGMEEEEKSVPNSGTVSADRYWTQLTESTLKVSEMLQEKKTPKQNSISSENTQAIWSNSRMSVEERKKEGARQFRVRKKIRNIFGTFTLTML